jgi:hypothetical protein
METLIQVDTFFFEVSFQKGATSPLLFSHFAFAQVQFPFCPSPPFSCRPSQFLNNITHLNSYIQN